MKRSKKKAKNLDRRVMDHSKGSEAASRDKQGERWSSGGYHMPGSNKK